MKQVFFDVDTSSGNRSSIPEETNSKVEQNRFFRLIVLAVIQFKNLRNSRNKFAFSMRNLIFDPS